MSQAIIVQREANGLDGGNISGRQTLASTDMSSTWYGRRLTDMLVNESGTVVNFTASTGGGTLPSTEGTFTLSVGDYRITVEAVYNTLDSQLGTSMGGMFGLYNVTTNQFETYSGSDTDYVISTPFATAGTEALNSPLSNVIAYLVAKITVSDQNKTFAIRQQGAGASTNSGVGVLTFCGARSAASGMVAGAAPLQTYCTIEILRTA